MRAALQEAVERLPDRLRDIIMARYGLAGKSATSYREIGATLGLTGERIRQLHTEALVWLRHPAHSQYLRTLLERHTVADYETAQNTEVSYISVSRARSRLYVIGEIKDTNLDKAIHSSLSV